MEVIKCEDRELIPSPPLLPFAVTEHGSDQSMAVIKCEDRELIPLPPPCFSAQLIVLLPFPIPSIVIPPPATIQTMEVIRCEDRELIPLPPPYLFLAFSHFSLPNLLSPHPKLNQTMEVIRCEDRELIPSPPLLPFASQSMAVIRELIPLPPPDPLRNYTPGADRGGVDPPCGCDCLGLIRYFDAHMSNFLGGVETIENAVCMHEEDFGILWKHVDWRSGHTEVRRSRRLVLSFVCTVANYEYGFFWYLYQVRVLSNGLGCLCHVLCSQGGLVGRDAWCSRSCARWPTTTTASSGISTRWVVPTGLLALSCLCDVHLHTRGGLVGRLVLSFLCTIVNYDYGFFWYLYQDGKIEAQIKLTGILSVGALREGEERKYGTLLALGLYASIHQHFFVARMDMAVDCRPGEQANQVRREWGSVGRGEARMDIAVDCRPGKHANQVRAIELIGLCCWKVDRSHLPLLPTFVYLPLSSPPPSLLLLPTSRSPPASLSPPHT
ncbi:unnamed protein product [Closterium sp. Yama58-4]|nr:unnamed protein product [Closterium sp. Yama58-4]